MKGSDFLYRIQGLEVSFKPKLSQEIPAKAILSWDFGDDTEEAFNIKNPKHTYVKPGFYTVTLNIKTSDGVIDESVEHEIMVTDKAKTSLPASIYDLIDNYVPEELSESFTFDQKRIHINKWQLYIQPLVNHDIPLEEYNNELYYEGLENQLIMELAVWDYLNTQVYKMLIQSGVYIANLTSLKTSSSDGDDPGRDRIKQITTGPTEVQYFDTLTDSASSLYSVLSKALQPGGLIDELKSNLCTLAERLEIYLPFCNMLNVVKVPKVVNPRRKGPLSGPNPTSILNRR